MIEWTDEQRMLRESVRRMARERIAPRAAEMDAAQQFPDDIHRLYVEQGLLRLKVPAEFGGTPADTATCCLVVEEIARVDGASSLMLTNHLAGIGPLLAGTGEEQKARYLPSIMERGEIVGFALTEPGAGSDAAALRTKAVRVEGGYRIDGMKCFITNGGKAAWYVLFATLDPDLGKRGITAFLVDASAPGVRIGKKEDKMGMRASPTTDLILEGVFVPEEARLAGEGEGWPLMLGGLSETRIMIAALAVGLADGALEAAARYARDRVQFGQPVSSFQGIQFMVADMHMGVESARCLAYRAARMHDRGEPGVRRFASMAKCYASDVAMKVTTDAVQLMGGYGYMKDFPVERMMRDAKILQIFEGTNQIQRMIIGRDYFGSLS